MGTLTSGLWSLEGAEESSPGLGGFLEGTEEVA